MRFFGVFLAAAALFCSACSDSTSTNTAETKPIGKIDNDGGTMVLARDQRVAVTINRMAGIVSVLPVDPLAAPDRTLGRGVEIDTAYVVLRKDQVVRRILGLHGTPRLDTAVSRVGSEPTALAISAAGTAIRANSRA